MSLIKLRRATSAEWTAANPVLADGEAGFERNTGKLKVGNGTSSWTGLSYFLNQAAMDTLYASIGSGGSGPIDATYIQQPEVAGVDGQLLQADSTLVEGVSWITPAISDPQEVPITLRNATVTTGTPVFASTGLERTVLAGETWDIIAELLFDATVAGGVSVDINGLGSVTALSTTAFAHGTFRGPATATTEKQAAIFAGTIPATGVPQSTNFQGDFSGVGQGTPFSVSLTARVKVGANTTGTMRLRYKQGAVEGTANSLALYQGSWATFTKVGY